LLGHPIPRSDWVTGFTVRTLYLLPPSHADLPLVQNVQLWRYPLCLSLRRLFLSFHPYSTLFIFLHDDSPQGRARATQSRPPARIRCPAGRRRLDREWTCDRCVGLDADGRRGRRRAAQKARGDSPLAGPASPRAFPDASTAPAPHDATILPVAAMCVATPRAALRLHPRRRAAKVFRAATGVDAGERPRRRERARRKTPCSAD
jgi:hypothetical protein